MLVKIIFSGKVQGVGFRYRTHEYALALGITGQVRNTIDGSVELYAQGSPESIQMLKTKLVSHFGQNIKQIDSQEISSNTTYSDFRILPF